MPEVSVVMAVRNAEPFVGQAMESLLGQTFQDFELIVVDDCSTDRTPDLVESYADQRIHLVRLPENVGQPTALNLGIERARGDFVARMDGDDVARPDRLEVQVAFLADRPEVGLVGAQVETIDAAGRPKPSGYAPQSGEALVAWNLLLFSNPIAHSTALFRKSLIDTVGGYDPVTGPAEDRDLWSRFFAHARIDVAPRVLLDLRLHDASLSSVHHETQRAKSLAIRRRLIGEFLGDPDAGAAVERWYEPSMDEEWIEALTDLMTRILHEMHRRDTWDDDQLEAVRLDMVSRLGSLRRRDARVKPRRLLGRFLKR